MGEVGEVIDIYKFIVAENTNARNGICGYEPNFDGSTTSGDACDATVYTLPLAPH